MTDSWAQTADAAAYTDVAVTDAQVMQAQTVVEVHSARTFDATVRIGSRDVAWLKRAVAYQAVWMQAQPDLYTRLDFKTLPAGGRPVEVKDTALTLAPLAARALRHCSWLRSRSLHVRSPFVDGLSPISSDPDSSGNDAYQQWSGMG